MAMLWLRPELVLLVEREAFRLIVAYKHGAGLSIDHFNARWDGSTEDGVLLFGGHTMIVSEFVYARKPYRFSS